MRAGDIVPGDYRILQSGDLFVNEATLTGETYPAEKMTAILEQDTPLSRRINCLFMGTNVVSGTARAVVVLTGTDTQFGRVSQRLRVQKPETEFERGVKRFGYLLLEITMVLIVAIFAINVYLARPIIDSFLFSLALAVGLTPQLLPAIISINLAHGARQMGMQVYADMVFNIIAGEMQRSRIQSIPRCVGPNFDLRADNSTVIGPCVEQPQHMEWRMGPNPVDRHTSLFGRLVGRQ